MTLHRNICLYILFIGIHFASISAQVTENQTRIEADKLFKSNKFVEATPNYMKLLALNPRDPNYNYRYGTCLLFNSNQKYEALKHLEFAVKSDIDEVDAYYYMGKAYHLNYHFDDAILYFQIYKHKTGTKENKSFQVDRNIDMCKNGKKLLSSISDLIITEKKEADVNQFFRIYDLNEFDGNIVLLNEFQSKIDKKRNFTPVVFFPNSPNSIYFASYGEDESSGKNIYVRRKDASGQFTAPELIKGKINTNMDEDFPYMDPQGEYLYFSSNGHNSMGGYDIFRSKYNKDTDSFDTPENLDFAISSPDDDYFYIIDEKKENAYFASSRQSQNNKVHVYKLQVYDFDKQMIAFKGEITSEITANIQDLKLDIRHVKSNYKLSSIPFDNKGEFAISLPLAGEYEFILRNNKSNAVIKTKYLIDRNAENTQARIVKHFRENDFEKIVLLSKELTEEDKHKLIVDIIQSKSQLNPNAQLFDWQELNKSDDATEVLRELAFEHMDFQQIGQQIEGQFKNLVDYRNELYELQQSAYFQAQATLNQIAGMKGEMKNYSSQGSTASNDLDRYRNFQAAEQISMQLNEYERMLQGTLRYADSLTPYIQGASTKVQVYKNDVEAVQFELRQSQSTAALKNYQTQLKNLQKEQVVSPAVQGQQTQKQLADDYRALQTKNETALAAQGKAQAELKTLNDQKATTKAKDLPALESQIKEKELELGLLTKRTKDQALALEKKALELSAEEKKLATLVQLKKANGSGQPITSDELKKMQQSIIDNNYRSLKNYVELEKKQLETQQPELAAQQAGKGNTSSGTNTPKQAIGNNSIAVPVNEQNMHANAVTKVQTKSENASTSKDPQNSRSQLASENTSSESTSKDLALNQATPANSPQNSQKTGESPATNKEQNTTQTDNGTVNPQTSRTGSELNEIPTAGSTTLASTAVNTQDNKQVAETNKDLGGKEITPGNTAINTPDQNRAGATSTEPTNSALAQADVTENTPTNSPVIETANELTNSPTTQAGTSVNTQSNNLVLETIKDLASSAENSSNDSSQSKEDIPNGNGTNELAQKENTDLQNTALPSIEHGAAIHKLSKERSAELYAAIKQTWPANYDLLSASELDDTIKGLRETFTGNLPKDIASKQTTLTNELAKLKQQLEAAKSEGEKDKIAKKVALVQVDQAYNDNQITTLLLQSNKAEIERAFQALNLTQVVNNNKKQAYEKLKIHLEDYNKWHAQQLKVASKQVTPEKENEILEQIKLVQRDLFASINNLIPSTESTLVKRETPTELPSNQPEIKETKVYETPKEIAQEKPVEVSRDKTVKPALAVKDDVAQKMQVLAQPYISLVEDAQSLQNYVETTQLTVSKALLVRAEKYSAEQIYVETQLSKLSNSAKTNEKLKEQLATIQSDQAFLANSIYHAELEKTNKLLLTHLPEINKLTTPENSKAVRTLSQELSSLNEAYLIASKNAEKELTPSKEFAVLHEFSLLQDQIAKEIQALSKGEDLANTSKPNQQSEAIKATEASAPETVLPQEAQVEVRENSSEIEKITVDELNFINKEFEQSELIAIREEKDLEEQQLQANQERSNIITQQKNQLQQQLDNDKSYVKWRKQEQLSMRTIEDDKASAPQKELAEKELAEIRLEQAKIKNSYRIKQLNALLDEQQKSLIAEKNNPSKQNNIQDFIKREAQIRSLQEKVQKASKIADVRAQEMELSQLHEQYLDLLLLPGDATETPLAKLEDKAAVADGNASQSGATSHSSEDNDESPASNASPAPLTQEAKYSTHPSIAKVDEKIKTLQSALDKENNDKKKQKINAELDLVKLDRLSLINELFLQDLTLAQKESKKELAAVTIDGAGGELKKDIQQSELNRLNRQAELLELAIEFARVPKDPQSKRSEIEKVQLLESRLNSDIRSFSARTEREYKIRQVLEQQDGMELFDLYDDQELNKMQQELETELSLLKIYQSRLNEDSYFTVFGKKKVAVLTEQLKVQSDLIYDELNALSDYIYSRQKSKSTAKTTLDPLAKSSMDQAVSFEKEYQTAQKEGYKELYEDYTNLKETQKAIETKEKEKQTIQQESRVLSAKPETPTQQITQKVDAIKTLEKEIAQEKTTYKEQTEQFIEKKNTLGEKEVIENLLVRNVAPVKTTQVQAAPSKSISVDYGLQVEPVSARSSRILIDVPQPTGLVYRIQVGAFAKPLNETAFSEFSPISGESIPNKTIVRYMVGYFGVKTEAQQAQTKVRAMGYKDAFIVVYCDGKRISIAEADRLLATGACGSNQGVKKAEINIDLDQTLANKPLAGDSSKRNEAIVKTFGTNTDVTAQTTNYNYNKVPGAAEATPAESIMGLFYTVQVGVYNTPVPAERMKNIRPLVTRRLDNGQIRYSAGMFIDIDQARLKRKEAHDLGISDAFLTAYYKGQRITLQEAQKLLNQYGPSIYAEIKK